MKTKEMLSEILDGCNGSFISGEELADRLGITRAAIWKNIQKLQKEGYRIEAVPNKGYRMDPLNDVVSERAINRYLGEQSSIFTLDVHDSLSSTNSYLKEKADNLDDWYVCIAGNQTGGKGRSGRSFFSPPGTGLYLSTFMRPGIPLVDAARLTTTAAVAACRAIETCTEEEPKIKWINDVFVNGRKVCGILTETTMDFETRQPEWVITGIGFNVYEPDGGFPPELAKVAGSISKDRAKDLRARLAASFLLYFHSLCDDLFGKDIFREYRSRCFVLQKKINVIIGEQIIPAVAEDLEDNFCLRVRYEDGTTGILNSGEVSIRPE